MLPPSAHHSVEQDTGNHRLVEHYQEFPADVKRSQSPQDIHPDPLVALILFGNEFKIIEG